MSAVVVVHQLFSNSSNFDRCCSFDSGLCLGGAALKCNIKVKSKFGEGQKLHLQVGGKLSKASVSILHQVSEMSAWSGRVSVVHVWVVWWEAWVG